MPDEIWAKSRPSSDGIYDGVYCDDAWIGSTRYIRAEAVITSAQRLKLLDEIARLRRTLRAIVEADERGQGQPFADAMREAMRLLEIEDT